MNFKINSVFPHPEGPLTGELNGCLQDGSILQNEEDTGLNAILILSFVFIYNKLYTIYVQSAKCSLQIIYRSECPSYIQALNKIYIQNKTFYTRQKNYLQFIIKVFSFQGKL